MLWWLRCGDWRSPGAVRGRGPPYRDKTQARGPDPGQCAHQGPEGRTLMHALIRLTPFWRRTCGKPAPAPARPGAIAAGNHDLTTKLTHEPNNVKVYRIVSD